MGDGKRTGNGSKIEFQATVARVKTMADGGLRFEFDVPESATMQAAQLMECKRWGAVLQITGEILRDFEDEAKKGAEGESAGVGRRRFANRRDQRQSG
ncbi:MAG TPA: hypothetical protein PKD55_09645 [Bellilinea sp.]|nr:hypothetical protein [Bellilinea sp.]